MTAKAEALRTRYAEAAKKTGYGSIWLFRSGEQAVVQIQVSGEWVTALECTLAGLIRGRDVTRRYKHAGYGAIGLDVDETFVRVLIKEQGRLGWKEAIREYRDNNFSHCITELGVLDIVTPSSDAPR